MATASPPWAQHTVCQSRTPHCSRLHTALHTTLHTTLHTRARTPQLRAPLTLLFSSADLTTPTDREIASCGRGVKEEERGGS